MNKITDFGTGDRVSYKIPGVGEGEGRVFNASGEYGHGVWIHLAKPNNGVSTYLASPEDLSLIGRPGVNPDYTCGAAYCDDASCNTHGPKDTDGNLLYWVRKSSDRP